MRGREGDRERERQRERVKLPKSVASRSMRPFGKPGMDVAIRRLTRWTAGQFCTHRQISMPQGLDALSESRATMDTRGNGSR